MARSGTKLVVVLTCLAIVAGITSWWYRYDAAHRATQFWGAAASTLIAHSDRVQVVELDAEAREVPCATDLSADVENSNDLSSARGISHLRHALLSDGNYLWDQSIDGTMIRWRWRVRFASADQFADLLFADDLSAIGRCESGEGRIAAVSCSPMTDSLRRYWQATQVLDASKSAE